MNTFNILFILKGKTKNRNNNFIKSDFPESNSNKIQ